MNRTLYEEFKARNISSTIGELLVDIHYDVPPPKPKPKPKPKNYAKENVKRLKEIQAKRKLKEEERLKSARKESSSGKYRNVKSKVFTNRSTSAPSQFVNAAPPSVRNTERDPYRPGTADSSLSLLQSLSQCGAHSDTSDCTIPSPIPEETQHCSDAITNGDGRISDEARRTNSPIREEDISEIDLGSEENNAFESDIQEGMNALSLGTERKIKKKNNYVEENKLAVQRAPSCTQIANGSKEKLHEMGEVPKYLLQRQQQWKEEEIKRNEEKIDPTVPLGHRLLSNEERKQALEQFEKNRKSLLASLTSLPICSDTLRVRRQKESLEKQLSEVEEQIHIFSKNRVLIKYDD